jgi:hypothetical protein
MLTKKRSPLSNAGLIGLVLAISMTFCAGVVLARHEPRVRSGIIRLLEGVRRNVALDVSGKAFLDDDSDSERIWL